MKFLTVNDMKIDHDSIVNQEIKRKFVEREVLCNVNSLVEFSIKKSFDGDNDAPVTYEDIENLYQYPEYHGEYADFDGGTEEQRDAEIERLEALLEEAYDPESESYNFPAQADHELLLEEIQALRDLESDPAEIYEWWAVSSWLAEKLKAQGECVVTGYYNYWGRRTTGQAILLDGVISRIAEEMEILEGQAYSWADKQRQ